MPRPCPVCGSSEKTFASPKHHKQYTERGRLDVDDWYCHLCKARWEVWDYVREDVEETKAIRLANGNLQAWGEMPPRTCEHCQSGDVAYVQHDGHWRGWAHEILRYECHTCGEIWQEMAAVDDGKRLFRRIWRPGQTSEK